MPIQNPKRYPAFIKDLKLRGKRKIGIEDLTTEVMKFFFLSSERSAAVQIRAMERFGHLTRTNPQFDIWEIHDLEEERVLDRIAAEDKTKEETEKESDADNLLDQLTDDKR